LKELSRLALEHFSPMIPNQFHQLWREGIESNSYYLKLCGSGGGGYFLGFTKDLEHARIKLKDHQIEVIHSF
jgi:mevalonate kinase